MLARMAPTSTASPLSAMASNASREQRWRGKYLRALNVCPPAPNDNALQRRKSLSALSMRARLHAQRSWREDPSTKLDGRGLRPARVSFATTTTAKVFDDEPARSGPQGLTRSTRSQSDWSGFRPEEELRSAPIEIPTTDEAFDFGREARRTAKRAASERSLGLDRRRANSSHSHPHSNYGSGSGRGSLGGWGSTTGTTECSDELDGFVEDEWDDDDEDQEEQELAELELSQDENDSERERERENDKDKESEGEGDIFAMEEDLDSEAEADEGLPPAMRGLTLRSLRRAASENVLPIGRARPMAVPRRSLLGGLQEHDSMEAEADMPRLPDSFVPPHEMVQRDCFSLGMRDQLKRRPDQEHVI